jgi:hypothetical protein
MNCMQTLKPFERKKSFVLLTYGRVFDVMLSLNSGQTDIPTHCRLPDSISLRPSRPIVCAD